MTHALWMPEPLLALPQETHEAYDVTTVFTAPQAIECIDEYVEQGGSFDAYFLGLHPCREGFLAAARVRAPKFKQLVKTYIDDLKMRGKVAKDEKGLLLNALEQQIINLTDRNAGVDVLHHLVDLGIVGTVPILFLTTEKCPYKDISEKVAVKVIAPPYLDCAVGQAIDDFMAQQQPDVYVTQK